MSHLVAFVVGILVVAHIAGDTSHAEHTALLVEILRHLLRSHAALLHHVAHCRRIDITGAGTHHQTSQRSQTHRGIDDLAVLDGSYGSTVADVASDDLLLLDVHAKELAHAVRDIAVRGAVEAIAAYVILRIPLVRNGVEVSVVGHRGVESVVEHCHLRHIRHELVHGTDTCEVALVVYRCEVDEALNAFLHLGSDDTALLKEVTALHDTVSHSVDLVEALQTAVLRIYKEVEHEFHAFFVRRHVVHDLLFRAVF